MVRHTLNGIEIEEPIGFDEFKSIIKRTEHHGVSVEMSVGELEFYGEAAVMIQEAYDNDIDSELIYVVESSYNDIDYFEDYRGVVDLSTCKFQENEYCSVKCKVGEVGVKTTFNNRVDTKVDVNSIKSLDVSDLPVYGMLKMNLTIPAKGLLFKTKLITSEDKITSFNLIGGANARLYNAFDTFELNEYINISPRLDNEISFNTLCQFTNLDYDNLYLRYNINVNIHNKSTETNPQIGYQTLFGHFVVRTYNGNNYNDVYTGNYFNVFGNTTKDINFNNEILIGANLQVSIHVFIAANLNNSGGVNIDFTTKKNSYILVDRLEVSESSKSNVSLVHETISRVSEIISGLSVKSDWYGRDDSNVNDTQNIYGGGSLKALMPGFWLRNAVNTIGEEYKFEISFKELITNLNAIDNTGWGFSVENGNLYIRVERWDWFYKENVILEIRNPKSKKRTINADKIYTRLNVGYEKYGDIDDINSIDTFHTKREYSTKLKAVDNEINAISKFIACPYAIEFTRRKALDKTTEDWKYDENIFIFCVSKLEGDYSIDIGVSDSEGTIISADTLLNARISPLRNAIRWSDRFFEVNRISPHELHLQSATGNISAKYKPTNGYDDTCEDSIIGIGNEGSHISYKAPKLKPETLEVHDVITRHQYEMIKQDPYGIIIIDGESFWLESIERDLNTSESILKLIPKNE